MSKTTEPPENFGNDEISKAMKPVGRIRCETLFVALKFRFRRRAEDLRAIGRGDSRAELMAAMYEGLAYDLHAELAIANNTPMLDDAESENDPPVPFPSPKDILQMQIRQLEKTMVRGGPSEICGAIDAVESTLHDLRELVMPNAPGERPVGKET